MRSRSPSRVGAGRQESSCREALGYLQSVPVMDVLILGASPNSLSAARSLGRAGLRVVVAETTLDKSIASSRYVSRLELLVDGDD